MPMKDVLDILNDPAFRQEGRFLGKYRGFVQDNKDPLGLGRILPTVPQLSGMTLNWALPCTPYAGDAVGLYTIPPVGAKVWIEFERGDPNYPIWSGCFWQDTEVPTEAKATSDDPSQVKVLRTRVCTFSADDTDQAGEVNLIFNDPTVSDPVTITINMVSTGLTITVEGSKGTSKIFMDPQNIETSSETLQTKSTKDTTFDAGQNMTIKSGADMALTSSGKLDATASGDATFKGANVTVEATTALTAKGSSTATFQGGTSATLQASSGSATVSGMTVSVSGSTSTTVSGSASLTMSGASISFSP
ncbi:MAG: phage baseplate assembly protein V [Acidobacteriota bacterium]